MAVQPLNQPADIPPELDRWNWGAFFLNWIWGIANNTFIALLMFVPLVNIVMLFVLGAKGSRWAWQNVSWRDAEHFRRVQRNWAIAGFSLFVISLLSIAAVIVVVPRMMKNSDAYRLTMETVRADDRVTAALGEDIDAGYWVLGSVQVVGGGSGDAQLSIPVHGSHGWGWVMSHAVRSPGKWNLRLLVVMAGGAPIVPRNAKTAPQRERGFARYAWRFANKTLAKLTGSGTRDLIRSAGRMRYVRLAVRCIGTSLPPGYRELKQI